MNNFYICDYLNYCYFPNLNLNSSEYNHDGYNYYSIYYIKGTITEDTDLDGYDPAFKKYYNSLE